MARPVIALLTDFGSRDHYAGTMKGVALGICPDATLIDITHDLPPPDVLRGGVGLGPARAGIAAEAGDYRFVAPDNGVLTVVFDETPPKRIVELTERRYARATGSRPFEGRDRFAPAAAWLAKGVELSALGRPAGAVQRFDVPRPRIEHDRIVGEVLRVDRFGNLVTNIDRKTFDKMATSEGRGALEIQAGPHQIGKVVSTYADAGPGELCALFGSSEHLEI